MATIDPGAWLQAGSTLLVAVMAFVVGFFSRRTSATTEAIDKVRDELAKELDDCRGQIRGLNADTSAIRAHVAQIEGYLGAVQGDHYARRTWPESERRHE